MAALAQSLDGNAISPSVNHESDSNAIYMNASGVFRAGHGLTVTGHLNHRIQHYGERDLAQTQYGGSLNFRRTNRLFGFLSFSIGVIDTATKQGNTGLGLVTNLNMTRKFGLWETSADFSYSQYTQTLFIIRTTSNYNFGGTLRRKINPDTYWTLSLRESRSGLTAQQGSGNVSDTFGTNLTWRRYSLSGSYSQSNGEALLTADGTLTATPLGSIISNDFLIFDARSYGVYANARLFRRIYLGGGYTNVSSSTIRKSLNSFNNGDRYSARFEVRLRRLSIISRFSRAVQEASTVPGGPRTVNSYLVSISRWFNAF
jgi:hypothetical protein